MQCYNTSHTSPLDIITFCKSEWGLGMGTVPGIPALFPVQEFILKAYYGLPLDNETRSIPIRDMFNSQTIAMVNEQEFLQWLVETNRISTTDLFGIQKNLVLVIGQRGCKDTIVSVIVCYELYLLLRMRSPQKHFMLHPHDHIQISLMAQDPLNAKNMFDRVLGHAARSPSLVMHWDTGSKVRRNFLTVEDKIHNATTEDRKIGSVNLIASSKSADGVKGPNNIMCVLNGIAQMSTKGSDLSDRSLYAAVSPSLAMYKHPNGKNAGRMIMVSIPEKKNGLFYDEYCRSFDPSRNSDLLMFNLPSWIANPTLSSEFLKAKHASSPEEYLRVYGAQFSD